MLNTDSSLRVHCISLHKALSTLRKSNIAIPRAMLYSMLTQRKYLLHKAQNHIFPYDYSVSNSLKTLNNRLRHKVLLVSLVLKRQQTRCTQG